MATIRLGADHGCSVEFGTLFDNRFLTILCESQLDSDTGCEVHAQVDDLGDHYGRHFLWPNVRSSRLFS